MSNGMWDRYTSNAPVSESETPADTIADGEYPMKSLNAQFRAVEGSNDKGDYAFGELTIQWQVTEGSLKGSTTWMRHDIARPDPSGDDVTDNRRLYFVQHFLDASGLAVRIDPSWRREEVPHPQKPGKMMTKFVGKMLSRADVFNIAKDDAQAKAIAEGLKDLVAIIKVGTRKFQRGDGSEGESNMQKGIKLLTDANLNSWRTGASAGGGSAATASPPSSPYAVS